MEKNILDFTVLIEQDEDGIFIAKVPEIEGCYTQGKTVDEALKNIKEVAALILEEKKSARLIAGYNPEDISLHTITV